MIRLIYLFLLLVPIKIAAQSFMDVSKEAGLNHLFNVGDFHFGGGVAVLDFDMDGWEDLYVTGGANSDALFKNNGDGTFSNVFENSGLESTNEFLTQGVVAGDIDNDGDRDLFITVRSSIKDLGSYAHNLLFENNGDGTFTNITTKAGLDMESNFSTSACLGDVNLDGYLDIFVVNYIKDPLYDVFHKEDGTFKPNPYWGDHDCLYINNGDNTFYNATADYGLMKNEGYGFACVFTDFDHDNDLDIYVANDYSYGNTLYENMYPEAKFKDISAASGTNVALNGMGIAVGDYNNDGALDYFVANMGPSILLKNNKDKTFADESVNANITTLSLEWDGKYYLPVSWGTQFLDFDNDTDLDLFLTNGDLSPPSVYNPNTFYENLGDAKFKNISQQAGVKDPYLGRGSAIFDYDKDGLLDIVVVNQDYPFDLGDGETPNIVLYKNQNTSGKWIKVKLIGNEANKDGIGAKVKLYGSKTLQIREIDGGSSHLSQNSTIAHFGLGKESIAHLEIIWPGGKRQIVENVQTNRLIEIRENAFDTPILTSTISKKDLKESIAIHPNPASDFLHINVKNFTPGILYYDIINVLGHKMDSGMKDLSFIDTKEFAIPLNINLRNGTYIIRFSGVVSEKKIFSTFR